MKGKYIRYVTGLMIAGMLSVSMTACSRDTAGPVAEISSQADDIRTGTDPDSSPAGEDVPASSFCGSRRFAGSIYDGAGNHSG